MSVCFSPTPTLFPPFSDKHSLEGQRRDVQLVPARLHAEAGAASTRPGTKTPFVAPNPDRGAIGQTHRRGRGDSTPGGRDRRGAEAGPLGARGAGSLLLGAGLRAPHLRAGPAQQEKSGCGRLESQVPPPPGERRQGCRVSGPRAALPERKGGHCLLDRQYCSIAWPRPFPAAAGSLPSPRPSGGGSLAPRF